MIRILLVAFGLVGAKPVWASAPTVTYQGSLDETHWQLEASLVQCRLSQDVPDIGRFSFEARAGEKPRAELSVYQYQVANKALVTLDAPNAFWQKRRPAEWIGQTRFKTSTEAWFNSQEAQLALEALRSGSDLRLRYEAPGFQEVLLVLHPTRFFESYQAYQACRASLASSTFWEVAKSAVYFESGSARLTQQDKQWLRDVAAYAREAETLSVSLEAYTDRKGQHEANFDLSKLRNETVKNYLISQGVPDAKIKTRPMAEKNPLADNHTASGRAHNRRVEIILKH